MVSRLRPLVVNFFFENRTYKLGETIDIALQLKANGDIDVREGRVDLMCEERYKQTFTVSVTKSSSGGMRGGGPPIISKENRQVTHSRKESYPHSTAVFLSEARLSSGTTSKHRVKLVIGSEYPQHMSDPTATEAEVSWALVAAFDVAKARDITKRHRVELTLA